jgi:hypothetical protein
VTEGDLKDEGRASPLYPGTSDMHLFRDGKRIVQSYVEIPDGALDFTMPYRSWTAGRLHGHG